MISVVIISKDEASLDSTLTAVTAQAQALEEPAEVVVVDASDGRLDYIRLRHQAQVRWVQFDRPPGVTVSIPHQRNAGVREAKGEIIVFTDSGCRPEPEWLAHLVRPVLQDEHIAAGITIGGTRRQRSGAISPRRAASASGRSSTEAGKTSETCFAISCSVAVMPM